MPRLAVALLRGCRDRGARRRRSRSRSSRGAPGQVAVSLATVVASVSLVVSMAIMVTSFRSSLDAWLGARAAGATCTSASPAADGAPLAPSRPGAHRRRCPASRASSSAARGPAAARSARPRVVAPAARPIAEADAPSLAAAASMRRRPAPPGRAAAGVGQRGRCSISTTSRPAAPSSCRSRAATVAVLRRRRLPRLRSPARARCRSRATPYVALTGDRTATDAALWRRAGRARRRRCARRSQRELPGGDRLEIALPGEIRALSLQVVRPHVRGHLRAGDRRDRDRPDRACRPRSAPLVLARRARVRRAAPRRHDAPAGRRDARRPKALATARLGVGVGLVLGAAISLMLIYVVNRQSFHWGMELALPCGELALFALGRGRAGDADRGRQRPAGDGRRRRARGEGGLVRRRASSRRAAAGRRRGALGAAALPGGRRPAARSSFPRDHGRHPGLSHRVVVRHRLGAATARATSSASR